MDNSHFADARAHTVTRYRPIEELIPPYWTEGDIYANGIRQHYYRSQGESADSSKSPLVLLHGILEGALTWLRSARALEQEFDIYMLDARGHGKSDRIAGEFTQTSLNADVAEAIRSLGLPPVHLLGFSQGATTAIRVAANNPELVRSLIVAGWSDEPSRGTTESASAPTTDVANAPGYVAWLNAYIAWLEQLRTQTHAERMVSALSQTMPGTPLLPEEDYVAWVENCAQLDLDLPRSSSTLWSRVAELTAATKQALGRVTCPALMIKSGMFPQPGAAVYAQAELSDQPNVQVIHFVNAGHLIHQYNYDLFMQVVKSFLQEQRQSNN